MQNVFALFNLGYSGIIVMQVVTDLGLVLVLIQL